MSLDPRRDATAQFLKVGAITCLVIGVSNAIAAVLTLVIGVVSVVGGVGAVIWLIAWLVRHLRNRAEPPK